MNNYKEHFPDFPTAEEQAKIVEDANLKTEVKFLQTVLDKLNKSKDRKVKVYINSIEISLQNLENIKTFLIKEKKFSVSVEGGGDLTSSESYLVVSC
jgi:hypothetical protein